MANQKTNSIDVTDNNNIVVTPKKTQYTLEKLLADVKSEDFSGEYDWGEAVGEEIW
ncbi:MAG: hypothetical protein AAGA80_21955 [Cyanobacteria bacterium P01_F01_bin.143]